MQRNVTKEIRGKLGGTAEEDITNTRIALKLELFFTCPIGTRETTHGITKTRFSGRKDQGINRGGGRHNLRG